MPLTAGTKLGPYEILGPIGSFRLLSDTELLEYICSENNKDLRHLVGK
jgi:hypothetical protein